MSKAVSLFRLFIGQTSIFIFSTYYLEVQANV